MAKLTKEDTDRLLQEMLNIDNEVFDTDTAISILASAVSQIISHITEEAK